MGWDYCSYQQRCWGRWREHVLCIPLWKGRWQSYAFLMLSFWKLHPPVRSSPKTCSRLTIRSFPRTPNPIHKQTHTLSDPLLHRWLWYINESYFYMFPILFYSAGYDISMSLISTSHQFLTTTFDTQYCSYIWTFGHLVGIYLCVYCRV